MLHIYYTYMLCICNMNVIHYICICHIHNLYVICIYTGICNMHICYICIVYVIYICVYVTCVFYMYMHIHALCVIYVICMLYTHIYNLCVHVCIYKQMEILPHKRRKVVIFESRTFSPRYSTCPFPKISNINMHYFCN